MDKVSEQSNISGGKKGGRKPSLTFWYILTVAVLLSPALFFGITSLME